MNISITGAGVVSTLGLGNRSLDFSKGLPQSNIQHCKVRSQPDNYTQEILSVPDLQSHPLLGARGIKFLTRGTQQLFIASHEAMEQISPNVINPTDLGIVIGSNYASLEVISNYDWTTVSQGPSFVSVMDIPNTLLNAPASQIAIKHCAKAFNSTISSGRCASLDAIGYAAFFLEQKRGRYALAGGLEELNPTVLWQLNSQWQHPTHKALFGEAAAVVFLDATQISPSQASLAGWANYWSPRLSLKEVVREAVQNALVQASLSAEDIGLVAMGIGFPSDQDLIDGLETILPRRTGQKVKAFSLNPIIGETIGASGAMHLVAVLSAFKNRYIPPTLRIENIVWRNCFEVSPQILPINPCPTLIVEMDPSGGASALVIVPSEKR
jgi:3-oxoacyl-[acyl-carrier-protein] synthase II